MRRQSGARIRPLLGIRKRALVSYLTAKGLPSCFDSSNSDTRFLRNRIRLHLLPILEQAYETGIRAALLKTADNLAMDEDLLEQQQGCAWDELVQSGEGPSGPI